MGERVQLVIDPARNEQLAIDLPLEYRVPVETVRAELGVSPSVDLTDPIVAKAVALAGAARRADPPVRFALFGGVAHRLRCPASNRPEAGLRHDLHDMDLAIRLDESRTFQKFLRTVGEREGSALTFFESRGDQIFNSISGGQRLRWHMVVRQDGSEVVLGTLDIVADEFRFCHRFEVGADVSHAPQNGWTLSPTHLLLAKGQFIRRIPRSDSDLVRDRMLEPFGKREVVIGPERKDIQDLLALVHDHAIGDGPGEVSPTELARLLGTDWGFHRTLGLNLALVARSSVLAGVPAESRRRIEARLDRLRGIVASLRPKRRFALFGGAWWQEVDASPSVDSSAEVS